MTQLELNGFSIRKSAEEVEINIATSFYCPHKILNCISKFLGVGSVDGVVEADEVFFAYYYKGTKPVNMPRPSRKRGKQFKKRGISKDKVLNNRIKLLINKEGYMHKVTDIFISFILFIWGTLNWIYATRITIDINAFSSLKEVIIYIIVTILYLIIQVLYINKSKIHILNILLLSLPTIIWFIILKNSLSIDGFFKYDGIAYTFGFFVMIVVLFYNFYKIVLKYNVHS